MALTLEQQYKIADTAAFWNRLAGAMLAKAALVMAEDQSSMNGVNYNGLSEAAARTSLAAQVINAPIDMAKNRRWLLIAQAADLLTWNSGTADEFAASIADANYLNFVSINWNVIAGWREAAF